MLYRELDLKNMISKYNKYRNIFLDIIIMLYREYRYFKLYNLCAYIDNVGQFNHKK